VENTFILGEAVDDAASHMSLADAALTWTTPSAESKLAGIPRKHLSYFFIEHDVPLKDGRALRSLVARPYEGWYPQPGRNILLRNRLLETFRGSLDVEIKRQNTARFLDQADAVAPMHRYLLPALHRKGTNAHGGLSDLDNDGADDVPLKAVPDDWCPPGDY
jgi:hypothetical protein